MENPIKMDDLEVPLFLETPIYIYTYIRYMVSSTFHVGSSSLVVPEKEEVPRAPHKNVLSPKKKTERKLCGYLEQIQYI